MGMRDDVVDSLNRRKPFAPPMSTGKRVTPTAADLVVFEYLDTHGPLPATYLFEASRDLRRNYKGFQKRLRDLRNESNTPHDGPYLSRPPQQKHSIRVLEQPLAYDNTEAARIVLRSQGTRLYPKRCDPMHHRFMNACTTASVRLAALAQGLEFVPLTGILGRHTCPPATRDARNPLAISTTRGTLVPDDLNGIAYPGAEKRKFRFVAWEQDRATETLNSVEFKFHCYLDVLRTRAYQSHWGVPSLLVLVVTTRAQRMQNMMALLEQVTAKDRALREHFLFKCKPEFAEEWIVPPIMTDLLTDPWERPALGHFFLDRA